MAHIIRRVKVNRARSPYEALAATGRDLDIVNSVVQTMPQGNGRSVELHLFHVGQRINDPDLDKEYVRRNLKPADPYSLAALNEAYPRFADECPNATHWINKDGWWSYAGFAISEGERRVLVYNSSGLDWNERWWFAGILV